MTMEQGRKVRLTTVVVLALVLVAGVALGAALDRGGVLGGVGEREGSPALDTASAGGASRRSADRSREGRRRDRPLLVEQVGLSPEQKEAIDSIVAFHRARMRDLHDEFNRTYMTRYREILEETRDAIRGVLTDEQRAAYDSILVEADRRREDRRSEGERGAGQDSGNSGGGGRSGKGLDRLPQVP